MKSKPSVLITGAAGGIGRALVECFHNTGYFVIATDIEKIDQTLPCDHFIQADLQRTVEDGDYATEVFQQVRSMLPEGSLDALINNAAVQLLGSCENLSREAWQQTLNVNVLAPFFWTQALQQQLESASGSVVNISSIHARLSKKEFIAYATSKAALSALTRNMALELGDKIRINAIEPAAVRTEMLTDGFADKSAAMDSLADAHPLGRIAETAEIANIALFLCSKNAGFLHGCIIPADGGLSGRLHDPG